MSTDLIWNRTTEDTEQIQRKKTALMWYRWNTSAHHTKHYWEVLGFRTSTGLASQGQTHSRKTYDLLTKIGSHLGRGVHVRWNPRQTRMASHLERPNQRPSPKLRKQPRRTVAHVWSISTTGILWHLESTEIRFWPGFRPGPVGGAHDAFSRLHSQSRRGTPFLSLPIPYSHGKTFL